jgi:hypothetical protein
VFVVIYDLQVELYTMNGQVDINVPFHAHFCDYKQPARVTVNAEPEIVHSLGQHFYSVLSRVHSSDVLQVLYYTDKGSRAAVVNLS